MRRHVLTLLALIALGGLGVAWQVHTASEEALAAGRQPVLLCPFAAHPGG